MDSGDVLLTPSEVAAKFRVDPKTVTRWAKAGRISAIRTLGGHRRYYLSEVQALLQSSARAATSGPAAVLAEVGAPLGELVEE